MNSSFIKILAATLIAALVAPTGAFAHGSAGKRFFPATITTEDPFVADELALPTVSTIREPASGDEPATRETSISGEFAKRITPNLAISFAAEFINLDPEGEDSQSGFGNLEAGVKYQLLENDKHEMIFSVGAGWEIGGTGRRVVGAHSFSTFAPAILFGKGFGDLPDSIGWLRPFALTGVAGVAIPTSASSRSFVPDEAAGERALDIERHPNVLQWSFVLEYSLPYLQSNVKDIGLRAPFDRLIPLVEFAFETPLDRGQRGETTGTINPGFIWSGKYAQIGVEAVIPVNSRTGNDVGVIAQLHFYLDDLFPHSLGRPLFGGNR